MAPKIGALIKAKRKRERLSAEDLALKLGLKKENIYKWERGSTPSDPEEYKIIQDWLNNLESIPKNEVDFYRDEVMSSLEKIYNHVTGARAEIRGSIEYQAMKDASGSDERRREIMAQISKLIDLNLPEQ